MEPLVAMQTTIRGSRRSCERPAAPTVALITDVADDLGAVWPVLGTVEALRQLGTAQKPSRVDALDLACGHKGLDVGLVAGLHTTEGLRGADGQTLKARVGRSLPQDVRCSINIFYHLRASSVVAGTLGVWS